MKALVTGGTGFLGSHLIQSLRERGDEVVCIAKDKMNLGVIDAIGVKFIFGNISDNLDWDSALDGVDVVYHLAGTTRARNGNEYYETNYLATKSLLEICSERCPNLQRFLYVSSLAAVGPSHSNKPIDEEEPYRPVSDYGKSKMLGEMEVLKAKGKLPITIIRPSSVYGPRERDMYDLIRMSKRGIFPMIGFGEKYLSLIHSDDLIKGLIQAALHPRSTGEIYFLGSQSQYSSLELRDAIAKAVSRNPFHLRVPHSLLFAVGALSQLAGKFTGKPVFLNIQKAREMSQSSWTCSSQKAEDHFGFCQSVSLEEGMMQTHKWYLDNGWL